MVDNVNIGWIGLGKMGAPMALNLVNAGYSITVYNRSAKKSKQLVDAGAKDAGTIGELAKSSDLIITMLADDNALNAVVSGNDGVFGAASSGAVLIDMSTVSPEASTQISRQCKQKGLVYLSAPVLGSTKVASDGVLTILVSGPQSAYEAVSDIFNVLGKKIVYLGEEPGIPIP